MRHWKIWLYLVGMLAVLGGCYLMEMQNRLALSGASTSFNTAAQTKQPVETAAPAAQVTPEVAGEQTETPTEAPTQTEVAVVDAVDQCLACHTDKAQLIDSAASEIEVVTESEGAG